MILEGFLVTYKKLQDSKFDGPFVLNMSPWLLISLKPTQNRPLTGVGFVIYDNVSWQLARHGVALTRPCRPFQPSLTEGAPPATWRSLSQRLCPSCKDLSVHPRLPWRQWLQFISAINGGLALPHPWVSGMKDEDCSEGKWEISAKEEQRLTIDQTPGSQLRWEMSDL